MDTTESSPNTAPIFIISGGAGALGKHVARIGLSQFPDAGSPVIVIPQVRQLDQLADAVAQVVARGGRLIIHTMVDPRMRAALLRLAEEHDIATFDTIGDVLDRMAQMFGKPALGQPGLYKGEEAYQERIRAIEYTVDHDDGRNTSGLAQADVVLTGVSRVGKTPLSIYLSVLGWKVANVPLVREVPPPAELFQIDRRRVVGLMIDVGNLVHHRSWRQRALMGAAGSAYSNPETLYEEIDFALRICRKGGFAVVNVTNKPIEETADEVIALISRWFEHKVK